MINPYLKHAPYQNEYEVHNDIREHIFSQYYSLQDTIQFLPYEELYKRNWSDEFEYEVRKLGPLLHMDLVFKLMRNRLIMGVMRYGEKNLDYHSRNLNSTVQQSDYNLWEAYIKKFKLWGIHDNDEYLIDCCNYLLLMYVYHMTIYPQKDILISFCRQFINIFEPKEFKASDRNDRDHVA